jgi:hypothetical protein
VFDRGAFFLRGLMNYLRQLVDKFMDIAAPISATLLEQEGIYSRADSESWINDAVDSMDTEQREALIAVVTKERQQALLDALVLLDEELSSGDLELVYEGENVDFHADGLNLHQQFLGQLAGDNWSILR